nr:hypothetical protein [uncultured Carboxylicivirga sp.]
MMIKFIATVLLVLFILPVIFQLAAGNKALKRKIKLRFRMVCAISVLSQILASAFMLILMSYNARKSGISDGLGFFGVQLTGSLMLVIIIIVCGIQLMVFRTRKK